MYLPGKGRLKRCTYGNRDTSFSISNQSKTSFYTYNHENHSKPSQDHYHPSTSSSQQHLYRPHYTPLEDETVIRELFQQHQQPFSSDHNYHDTVIVAFEHSTRKTNNLQSTMNKSSYTKGKFATATSHVILHNNSLRGKKASKKDRHSKINTAQGLRDRRMRLSFDVEKKFFKLQDMLGFEKANNTIEWLLMKSKHTIQDLLLQQPDKTCSLIGVSKSASSTSECEVIIVDKLKSTSSTSNREKKKPCRGVRNSGYIHHSVAKETRAQARARARKRTTEKRNYKLGCGDAGVSGCGQYPKYTPCFDQVMDQNINRLGSCCPFGENQVQTTDQAEYPGSHFQLKHGLVGDNSPGMPNLWSPSFLFNYQHNPGPSHE